MAKASAVLKQIAEAGKPLYMSLNDAQKERFQKLARMLRRIIITCTAASRSAGKAGAMAVTTASAAVVPGIMASGSARMTARRAAAGTA